MRSSQRLDLNVQSFSVPEVSKKEGSGSVKCLLIKPGEAESAMHDLQFECFWEVSSLLSDLSNVGKSDAYVGVVLVQDSPLNSKSLLVSLSGTIKVSSLVVKVAHLVEDRCHFGMHAKGGASDTKGFRVQGKGALIFSSLMVDLCHTLEHDGNISVCLSEFGNRDAHKLLVVFESLLEITLLVTRLACVVNSCCYIQMVSSEE